MPSLIIVKTKKFIIRIIVNLECQYYMLVMIFFYSFQFRIETSDRRGAILSFRCTLIQVDSKILVDFRLSRGCGIEFKKHFAKIKTNCSNIIEFGPIMWPTLIAPDAIPGGF